MNSKMRNLFFATIAILMVSCGETTFNPDATGRPGELVVVIENSFLEKEAGQAINEVFGRSQYGLPQDEPLFTIVSIPNASFNKVLQRHRNILIADIAPQNTSNITIKNDAMAKGQLFIQISAPSDSAFARIIQKNSNNLLAYYSEKELERLSAAATKLSEKSMAKTLAEKHKIELNIPKVYNLIQAGEDFSWYRYEVEKPSGGQRHPISRNLLIYNHPYTSLEMLKLGNIMDTQDSVTKKYIAGTTEGSYMKIVEELLPAKKEFNLNGAFAIESRGLWNLKNDFMGGPFINYTAVDTVNNQVVTLVSFVYAPNFDKREYVREMEGIMRTLKGKVE
jgi:hypothetical protein